MLLGVLKWKIEVGNTKGAGLNTVRLINIWRGKITATN